MNREILFRGQIRKFGEKVNMMGEKLPGKWVYGGIFPGIGDFSIIYGWKSKDGHTGDGLEKFFVYSNTVGQYTCSTDKNGVKIFEGDIIKTLETDENGEYRYFPVVHVKGAFWLYDKYLIDNRGLDFLAGYDDKAIEVIGNVFDNPELLEE